jgi:iduronate 2-sulfatase
LAELLDVYPTLADYCQLQPPDVLEGVSLRPVIEDAKASVRNVALTQNPRPAYRGKGVDPEVMGYSVRTDAFRYTQWRDYHTGATIATELYDHRNDPAETRNVVAQESFLDVVTEHTALLEELTRQEKGQP